MAAALVAFVGGRPLARAREPHPVLEPLAILPPESIGEIANAPRVSTNAVARLRVDSLEADGRRSGRGRLWQGCTSWGTGHGVVPDLASILSAQVARGQQY